MIIRVHTGGDRLERGAQIAVGTNPRMKSRTSAWYRSIALATSATPTLFVDPYMTLRRS